MPDEKETLADSSTANTTTASVPASQDAPPAYESLNLAASNSNIGQDTWRRGSSLTQQPISLPTAPNNVTTPTPFRPPSSTQRGHTRTLSSSSTKSTTSLKTKKSWFNFKSSSSSTQSSSRTIGEVRSTVCGLVRNLVVGPQEQQFSADSLSPAAQGILQSCAEACTTHSMSLSTILQEKFVESHSPLYWAIVKRPVRPHNSRSTAQTTVSLLDREEVEESDGGTEPSDLLGALLSHAKPLEASTIAEMRLACLATSDQKTFQRLHLAIPEFSSIPGADQILLGARHPTDFITVEIGDGTEGAFTATMQIPQFHKRMMVSREIGLEFVARNRLWRFSFLITPDNVWYGPPPGTWCVSISLQEPSPPTWLDAHLVIDTTTIGHVSDEASTALRVKSKQMMEAPRNGLPATQTVVSLDENPAFTSLQYSGSSYIPDDEILRVKLRAKLRKPAQDID
ncbi:hypothetical protein JR316_0005097 [Psilocybe cubensis]|uniref:Uncharacterized protein n=2 Tax=Psilocybe cubensis TaxID=181762 RepID=A0ACB8H5T0_PSICU|nr:hypothetical protein JR316_0005097 [Psilocybe cubensis]KAH9482997.1 hypothetical protein JR316_0005097 [Psilocybe cubensis]